MAGRLEVPDEAGIALLTALARAHRAGATGQPLMMNSPPDVLPIARSVVIAELRRQAASPEIYETPIRERLLDRVGELEEEAS